MPIELPPPVRPGARVGVAALSGPVRPERLAAGVAALGDLGFEVALADNLAPLLDGGDPVPHADDSGDAQPPPGAGGPAALFAGDDDSRLKAFHRLAAEPDIEAIFFARGGWGAMRLLERIDWPLLARRPRAYVGYSDLTPFLLAVIERLRLAAFHGPMVAADLARWLTGQEERSLLTALAGELPARYRVVAGEGARRPDTADGPLLGGCLSLLTATLGTRWASPLDGALLFIEEVAEPLYRLDRMLWQLKLAGRLERLRGIVFGHIDFPDAAGDPAALERRWEELQADLLDPLGIPWARRLSAGHSKPNLTLPLGLPARLEIAPDAAAGDFLTVGVS